jgi:chromosome segregation ATPase
MTSEEMERAIEIIFNNQANFEIQFEKTNRQVEQMGRQVEQLGRQVEQTSRQIEETNIRLEAHAETQIQFIQVMTRHVEAQGEINDSVRNALRNLSVIVERHISEGHNGKAQ